MCRNIWVYSNIMESLINSLMARVCLQLLMIARRKPRANRSAHAVAYTPIDATQQASVIAANHKYIDKGRAKTLR